MKWIPARNEFPVLILALCNGFSWESKRVLVYSPVDGIVIARYYADEKGKRFWWWKRRHGTALKEVTHWTPLPLPPKE